MIVATATQKMIEFYKGSIHDARSAIENFRQRVFRTSAGTELLDSMYLKGEENP
jgi:hypothetical protein